MIKRFSGIILAGGASRRMGTDKTRLKLQGKTLVQWQAEKLRTVGASEIFVCGTAKCDLSYVRCIPDMLPHRGPLGGIYSGLLEVNYPHAVVLSADVPLLPVKTLQMLLEAHRTDATLLCHGPQIEPLIGVYSQNLAPLILPLIRERSASVWALLDRCQWTSVRYQGDEALLCNCNTPEDFSEAARLAEHYGIR